MENPYLIIIICSTMVVFSYLFTQISKWTKIPSVIFLIGTGVGVQFAVKSIGIEKKEITKNNSTKIFAWLFPMNPIGTIKYFHQNRLKMLSKGNIVAIFKNIIKYHVQKKEII